MKHSSIKQAAIVTCHVCQTQAMYHVIEWPPLAFMCPNEECGIVWQVQEMDDDGRCTFSIRAFQPIEP